MELLSITLSANETKQFAKAGRYFEIIDASFPLQIDFTGPNGNLTDSMRNALSGLFLEDPYSHFAVTNGTSAQTVVVLLMETGRGGSRRQPGIVSITNKIGSLIAQTYGAGGTAAGVTANAVILPAVNVKGLTVRTVRCNITAGAGGAAEMRMVAAPTAPGTNFPANGYSFNVASPAASANVDKTLEQQNFQIPPGWGIWCVTTNAAAATVSGYEFAYELVP